MITITLTNEEVIALKILLGGETTPEELLSVTVFNRADRRYNIKRNIEESILNEIEGR